MAVAAAEQQTFEQEQGLQDFEIHSWVEANPPVVDISETAGDLEARNSATHFIGACAVGGTVEKFIPETVKPIESLYDAVQKAAEGDTHARKVVETNVRTDVVERTMKTGHVIEVDLHVDEAGVIHQYGQSMESVQANSLKYAAESPEMRKRTEAETTNAFRIKQMYENGELEDGYFVVFSPAADDMHHDEMKKAGFFTDTMSLAIQGVTIKNGTLTMESAFVSGVTHPGAERHDLAAIAELGDDFGIDLRGKTATEVLARPLKVDKQVMPNGVIDLVRMFDNKIAGETFFGEARTPQDYDEYLDICREREERFKPRVEEITNELISHPERISNRLEAVELLHDLSESSMVRQAVCDTDINPLVFGESAAVHIERARLSMANGEIGEVIVAVTMAQKTAVSSSCPSSMKKISASGLEEGIFGEDEDEYGPLTFTCTAGHTNRRDPGKLRDKCKVDDCKGTVGC